MYFTVTIDTEEDNWGEYDRPSYTVENIRRIPRLQQLFMNRQVRPTYLISYPVATSPAAIEILGGFQEKALCEIGTHPHPWNTPPHEEERTPFNSYINHLPSELQYRKIKTLHEVIARNFGVTARTYRSGRWGFSRDVATALVRLGYDIDTSISPALDWREYEGPDYSRCSSDPFLWRTAGSPGSRDSLLEIPATVDFVQRRPALARSAYRSIKSTLPLGDKVLAVLGRLRVLNRVCISPEINDAPQMIRLIRALLGRGAKIVNMFFHSPSLLENCSPFARTSADVETLLGRVDAVAAFAQAAGMRFVTMSELRRADLGPLTVKSLLPSGAM